MIKNIIFNRLLFSLIPFVVILFIYVLARVQFNSNTLTGQDYFMIITLIILAIFLFFELKKISSVLKKRKKFFKNTKSNLIKFDKNQEIQQGRIRILDTQIHLSNNNLDIFKSNSLKVSCNKNDNLITIFKSLGNLKIQVSDIKFLFVEYYDLHLYTLKGIMTKGELDKNRWQLNVSVVLSDEKVVKIMDAFIDETYFEKITNYIYDGSEIKINVENNYFELCERIISKIARFLEKDYIIIDYSN